jgi:ribosomal protein L7/L12 domain protein
MHKPLLKKNIAAIAALLVAPFALPQQVQAQDYYDMAIIGTRVTSQNCNDLSTIQGVSGTVKFDPATNTLTLENATIKTIVPECVGLESLIKDLTINVVGNNSITSESYWGLFNDKNCNITIKGSGKLVVNGAMSVPQEGFRRAIFNWGTIVVDGCDLEACGGVYGLGSGYWKFKNCNVRAKGGGESNRDAYAGSITWVWDTAPEFVGCKVTAPAGAYWTSFENNKHINYVLVDAEGKVVTDWVEITRDNTNISAPNIATAAKRGIYTAQGLRCAGELKDQPAGIYIVGGKKVMKP